MSKVATIERAPKPIEEVRHQLQLMEPQFKAALPAHIPVERFARVVMTAIQNNPKLLNCTRQSLFNACMRAAQDGLLPDGRDGAIVPYGENEDGQRKPDNAQWMPMIGGIRKKARNSGEIATWEAHVVCKNDDFAYELGDESFIRHRPALDDRGPITAAYSIAKLKDGSISREIMSIKEIEGVKSKSKAKKGPWNDAIFFPEMCRKVVARRHAKVLPMSSDLDDLIRRDDDLYDLPGAREEAQERTGGRPQSLGAALDNLAALPERVIDHAPHAEPIAKQDSPECADRSQMPEPDTNPEFFLSWLDEELGKFGGSEAMAAFWDDHIVPLRNRMFPPDVEEAEALYRKHRQRLAK